MSRKIVLPFLLVVVGAMVASGQQLTVQIVSPPDRAQVPERPLVEGTVSNANAPVWVIVHPMEVADYWVQPKPTVKEDGTWKAQIHIGRPGGADVGKLFEIMAVADPKKKLNVGDVLKAWPEAKAKSRVIDVTRK